jgi:hypothetical protein
MPLSLPVLVVIPQCSKAPIIPHLQLLLPVLLLSFRSAAKESASPPPNQSAIFTLIEA